MRRRNHVTLILLTVLSPFLMTGLAFAVDNTFPTSGNVGIGTTSPSSYTKLDVEGAKLLICSTSSFWGQLQVANPIDSESTIAIAAGGSGSPGNDTTYTRQWIMGINPYGVGVDRFAITNKGLTTSAPFVIKEDGNIGIGTTNPSERLSVNGSISKETTTGYDGAWDNFIKYGHKNDLESGTSNVNRWIGIDATITAGAASANKMKFRVYPGTLVNPLPIDVMTLQGDGNVGIGTTSPSSYTKLDIEGNKLLIRSTSNSWGQLQVANPNDNESTITIAAGGSGSPGNDTIYTRQWIMGINPYGVGVDRFAITNKGLTTSAPFVILEGGNVGIGTTTPTGGKLVVNGTIRAKEVKVENNIAANEFIVNSSKWSDFVFEDNYKLPSLNHVESFIKENKHLPEIPSAKEVEEDGLSMSQMMTKQMQKIEELTLYVIEQNKQIEALKTEVTELKKKN